MKAEDIKPYEGDHRDKGQQVRQMFDNIAPAYDFMNRAMTLGIDKLWRRRTVKAIKDHAHSVLSQEPAVNSQEPGARSQQSAVSSSEPGARSQEPSTIGGAPGPYRIFDVATGTGDLAIQMARALPESRVTGIDLSEGMVEIGRQKVKDAGLGERVTLGIGDCLALPFGDASFDCVSVAFGVRNFEHLDRGYREMARVLRPGGLLVVLELSVPDNAVVRPLYRLYTRHLIPVAGRLVSKDVSAYSYLPASIEAVAQRQEMSSLIEQCGFEEARYRSMTMGVCCLYTATRIKSLSHKKC